MIIGDINSDMYNDYSDDKKEIAPSGSSASRSKVMDSEMEALLKEYEKEKADKKNNEKEKDDEGFFGRKRRAIFNLFR